MRTLAMLTSILLALVTQSGHAQGLVDYQRLKYMDIRDLQTFETHWSNVLQKTIPGTDLQGTAELIERMMTTYPARFVGPVVRGEIDANAATPVLYYKNGARGPSEDVNATAAGNVYVAEKDFPETRKNTIFSAEFEAIEKDPNAEIYTFRMVMFVHDSSNGLAVPSNGYFFRRIWVRVDWTVPKANEYNRVIVFNQDVQDIPLNATKFQIVGDILERKVVLQDTVYGITKVFPLGLGSFDIRTDGQFERQGVESLTEEFPSGYLAKASGGPGTSNTRYRTYPSYYSGRPFFGLFRPDGEYRAIGMHFQIEYPFIRGFISHGCIRVRDKDLYQLDAILNEGPHAKLAISFLNSQPNHAKYIHVMPKENSFYKAVVYSTMASPAKILCPPDLDYNIRYNGPFHTVADGECLTKVERVAQSPQPVIDYILQRSGSMPQSYLADVDNDPTLMEQGQVVNWDSEGGERQQRRRRATLANVLADQGGFLGDIGNFLNCGFNCPKKETEIIYVDPEPRPTYTPPMDIGIDSQVQVQELAPLPSTSTVTVPATTNVSHSAQWNKVKGWMDEMVARRDTYCNGNRWVPIKPLYADSCVSWKKSLDEYREYLITHQ